MPLESTIKVDKKTTLYIWEVREELAVLEEETPLTPEQKESYNAISNERAKKNFLATRSVRTRPQFFALQCLREAFFKGERFYFD